MSTDPNFPMPNDVIEGQGIVIASTWYREDISLATIVVLRPEPPFYRVGVWDFANKKWDGGFYDHRNIVPTINSETVDGVMQYGYQELGGDY